MVWTMHWLVGFLAMPGFLEVFGYYDTTLKKLNIDPTTQQLVSALMTVGVFVAALLLGTVSSKLGRRQSLWLASTLSAISTAIQLGTTNKIALYIARLILGIANGFFLTYGQLYVSEACPPHLRGIGFGIYQFMLSLGSIVGACVDKGTSTMTSRLSYQIPLAVFFVVPTIQSVLIIFFPESPRWLMLQGA